MKFAMFLAAVLSLAVTATIAGGRTARSLPAAALFPQAPPRGCDASPLLVRNTTVWTRDGLLTGRDVLFRDGRVVAVEPTRRSRPEQVRTIDGTGQTLLPGLVDAHLHLSIPGGLPGGSSRAMEIEEVTGRQLVRSGVTSGRLHLATLEEAVRLKARSADPCTALPRLQVGGPGLSGAVEKDGRNYQGARSVDDARAKVERLREAGIDWLAIHDADRFPPGVLATIVTAARAAGIRLMAAAGRAEEIAAALTVAPETLEYLVTNRAPYTSQSLDAIRQQKRIVLVPTLGVPYRTAEYVRDPALLDRLENFEFLTKEDRAFVLATGKKHLVGQEGSRAQSILPVLREKFTQLRTLGLPMAVGSDAGSPLQFQSGAIWWELEAWRAMGVSHRDALIAATESGARVLGLTDIGRVAVGSRADFVLYRGNVEDGPFEMARVMAVAKGGVVYVAGGTYLVAGNTADASGWKTSPATLPSLSNSTRLTIVSFSKTRMSSTACRSLNGPSRRS
jgi:imidazolonepropionase-like amidohydrolase